MSGALLDVNVLVALFDPEHVHHEPAHDWFADNRADGWATCPVTECGFVRILANPGYGAPQQRAAELIGRLRKFCTSGYHEFWPDTLSLRDETIFDARFFGGHRQVTDVYLLGLAKSRRGKLATFDRTIPLNAIVGARAGHLAIIGPIEAP
jgi:toxin-antitoxin system PIN domain toxin